jgi:acyl-CoA thioester hydrolase
LNKENKLIYKRKVNFYETDAQGIVHHSNYPRYFEEARGYYLEHIGFPYHKLREELRVDVVLLSLNVQYLKPVYFGEELEIRFSIIEKDKFFFKFKYEVFSNQELKTVGETKHCCLNRDARKIIKIPQILYERMV